MRKKIAKNILETRTYPNLGGSHDEHNRMANHCAYVILGGDRCTGKDRQYLIDHPESFLDEIPRYDIITINNLKHEVVHDKYIIARFFKASKAIEYVLLMNELI